MERIFNILFSFIEPAAVLLILILLLIFNKWLFSRIKSGAASSTVTRGSVSFLLILLGLLAFILVLPVEENLKGQILSFFGIIITAGIALSSTTVLGNLIAGIMNNSMNRFRNGDLIKIGDFHGRVIKKSVFHTEIQLEDSNFITVPNLYIASNPVKLIRKTNTVISTSVTLGYDVSHEKIEEALKTAALSAGLSDPYVYIITLGDYSVEYKIHGFLNDSGKYFSTNSLLNAKVIDTLHEQKIEIVSPTFMNQRRVDELQFIPREIAKKTETGNSVSPEDLIFDEAIKSGKIETKKDYLQEIDKKLESLKERLKDLKEEDEIEKLKGMVKRTEELKIRIENSIKDQTGKD